MLLTTTKNVKKSKRSSSRFCVLKVDIHKLFVIRDQLQAVSIPWIEQQLSVAKPKTKVKAIANQNRAKYHKEPMKTNKPLKARENASNRVAIGFNLNLIR